MDRKGLFYEKRPQKRARKLPSPVLMPQVIGHRMEEFDGINDPIIAPFEIPTHLVCEELWTRIVPGRSCQFVIGNDGDDFNNFLQDGMMGSRSKDRIIHIVIIPNRCEKRMGINKRIKWPYTLKVHINIDPSKMLYELVTQNV